MTLRLALSIVGFASAGLYLLLLAAKALLSLRAAARRPEVEELDAPVTILQPILGGDPSLRETLQTNLKNASDSARFVWLIDEADTVGREAAEPLVCSAVSPERATVILCRPCPAGINPKLFKLNLALPGVATEYVAVLDDDTSLSPEHLPRAIAALTDADLYTGLPRYTPGVGLWSELVAQFVNNNSVMTYLSLLDWTGPLTINGMFYVVRTDTLRSWGGFQPILDQLCDDYALARLAQRHGGRIRQGTTSQLIQTFVDGPRRYVSLMHRWFVFANVLVLDQPFGRRLLLAAWLGLPPLLLWGSLLCGFGGWPGTAVLGSVLLIRHAVIRGLRRRFFGGPQAVPPIRSLTAELLQPPHLIHAILSPVIVWRSRRIRVGRGGAFTSLDEGGAT